MSAESNIVNFEKFKLKQFLEKNGFQVHEDSKGKVRIWIRRPRGQNSFSGRFSLEKENKH